METVTKTCPACGNDFQAAFKHGAKYCSTACRVLVHPIQSKKCVVCGQEIYRLRQHDSQMWGRKKCCSRKCMGQMYRKTMKVPCAQCGREITGKRSRFEHKRGTRAFCSNSCQAEFMRLKGNAKFDRTSPREMRRSELSQYRTTCDICGFDRFIEYAHIIPRRDGGSIHQDNILALCPNHHRLFDRHRLTADERGKIEHLIEAAYQSKFSTVCEGAWVSAQYH